MEPEDMASHKFLKNLVSPHIESFNYFVVDMLSEAVKQIRPIEFMDRKTRLKFYFEDASISMPYVGNSMSTCVYPYECRIRGTTYKANLIVRVGWSINDEDQESITRSFGHIPIMVKSDRCALKACNQSSLIEHHEEASEQGGYFICSGIERVLRLIVVNRRNYPLAISMKSWKTKSSRLSEFGVTLRSVNDYNRTAVNVLHYKNDSTLVLSISHKKRVYYIPFLIVMKMLVDYTEFHIFTDLLSSDPNNSSFKEAIKCMFSQLRKFKIISKESAKNYIGKNFRLKLGLPDWFSDAKIADILADTCICLHVNSHLDKYRVLILMAHKLIGLITKKYVPESTDTINNQEILLPGQLFQVVLLDKMESWLSAFKQRFLAIRSKNSGNISEVEINTAMGRCSDVGLQVEYFIRSGNLVTKNSLGLPQANGFSIIADKLNYMRYIAHFRSLHRGAYFTQSYSTNVRKLLPETWGFLCPVHTPDGAPCGLLTYFAQSCEILCRNYDISPYLGLIVKYLCSPYAPGIDYSKSIGIYIDGRVTGYIQSSSADLVASDLNLIKVKTGDRVEIVYIPLSNTFSMFPGIFIFSAPTRLIRPVLNIQHNCKEYIGTFEQLFLNIAVNSRDIGPRTTHQEIDPVSILSITASLTPFSQHNQSPRNMYQCQMMKQSMGIPCLNLRYRFDNKLYWLNCVQSPICQSKSYEKIRLDEHPVGFNAVVAVISYTGYDMEDAIIINKAAIDRGFASGYIYKSILIELNDRNANDRKFVFGCRKTDPCYEQGFLDLDGLPQKGSLISPGKVFYSYYDVYTNEYFVKNGKLSESAYVDDIAIAESDNDGVTKVNIRLRIQRNPIVGDKFSSRHGQKGILSIVWPSEDMPFTESGMIPDIIFNPHGFPSRMTIGMMIEIMAAKAGALNGHYQNSTPFQNHEKSPVDYFGAKLAENGFNYYGTERMYSGTNGQELEVNIFSGLVYYQRLRHMVSDKYQVRTGGPVDTQTHQPVGGRIRGGGVRFGEMERDCLISYGCPYLLNDRLMDCSDKSLAFICSECGDLLSTKLDPARSFDSSLDFKPLSVIMNVNPQQYTCLLCNSSAHIKAVHIPYIFRYLLVELASMNIRVKLNLK